jgi:chromatin assembly factor 1 subunit A
LIIYLSRLSQRYFKDLLLIVSRNNSAFYSLTDQGLPEKSSLIEVKNGKLALRQRPLSLEKVSETMQGASNHYISKRGVTRTSRPETVLFRQMLEQRLEQEQPPLEIIPDQYNPLIAKLVHERCYISSLHHLFSSHIEVSSDKTLQTLSKYIHHELLPAQLDDEEENSNLSTAKLLPLHIIEVAIKTVASRVNYGLGSDTPSVKVPAQMCIWRWEVHESNHSWLPKSLQGKIEARLIERRQVNLHI